MSGLRFRIKVRARISVQGDPCYEATAFRCADDEAGGDDTWVFETHHSNKEMAINQARTSLDKRYGENGYELVTDDPEAPTLGEGKLGKMRLG